MIVLCDGMVWSELGAAMPRSGGRSVPAEAFGPATFGVTWGFCSSGSFVVLSGPLEIAIGVHRVRALCRYIWSDLTPARVRADCHHRRRPEYRAVVRRRIRHRTAPSPSALDRTLIAKAGVIVTGALHFDPRIAFDLPPDAFSFSLGFLVGLGAASRVGVYDFLGYYDVCYIGDEVKNPGRVIPRSILVSTICVALIYVAINLSIIGIVPWREFVPADAHPASDFIVSTLMEKIYGSRIASLFTLLVLWTAFGSVFALLLDIRASRTPQRVGLLLQVLGRLHPTKGFPHVSLLVLGARDRRSFSRSALSSMR